MKTTTTSSARRRRRRPREGGIAHRIVTAFASRYRWYDWGHRVMVLVGRWDGTGTYNVPRGRDLWYWEDGKLRTTYDYAEVRAHPEREWKIFDVQNEGFEVKLGYWGDRIAFYGFDRAELRLFRRWDFWECRARGEWFGLRRWLYYRALHHAVHLKRPFACNQIPGAGTGGYSHWHCQERGRHTTHRFNNYTWTDGKVSYDPRETTS